MHNLINPPPISELNRFGLQTNQIHNVDWQRQNGTISGEPAIRPYGHPTIRPSADAAAATVRRIGEASRRSRVLIAARLGRSVGGGVWRRELARASRQKSPRRRRRRGGRFRHRRRHDTTRRDARLRVRVRVLRVRTSTSAVVPAQPSTESRILSHRSAPPRSTIFWRQTSSTVSRSGSWGRPAAANSSDCWLFCCCCWLLIVLCQTTWSDPGRWSSARMDCCNYMPYRQPYYGTNQYYDPLAVYHDDYYHGPPPIYPEYYGNSPYYPQHWQCAPFPGTPPFSFFPHSLLYSTLKRRFRYF